LLVKNRPDDAALAARLQTQVSRPGFPVLSWEIETTKDG